MQKLESITKERPIYKLTDDSGEILEGSFHEEELQNVIKEDNIFRIESILRKKKRGIDTFLLVKWKGYPETFSSWVNETSISRTHKKNIKEVIGHFLSNRNGPNTGVLLDITKYQFYEDIPYKYLDKFYHTTSKFNRS